MQCKQLILDNSPTAPPPDRLRGVAWRGVAWRGVEWCGAVRCGGGVWGTLHSTLKIYNQPIHPSHQEGAGAGARVGQEESSRVE